MSKTATTGHLHTAVTNPGEDKGRRWTIPKGQRRTHFEVVRDRVCHLEQRIADSIDDGTEWNHPYIKDLERRPEEAEAEFIAMGGRWGGGGRQR